MSALERVSNSMFSAWRSFLLAADHWRTALARRLNVIIRLSTAWRSVLRAGIRCRTLVAGHRSFGITSRLLSAFIGVGVLALAANFVVEQGVLIEKTTQITRTAPPPTPTPKPSEDLPQAIIEPPPVAFTQRRSVSSEPLKSALDRFGRAVQSRIATKTARTEDRK